VILQGPPPMLPMDPSSVVMIVTVSCLAAVCILWPIMRAIGRRLENKSAGDPALRADLEQMHQRLGEVDALQAQVAELEERVDFAERLLARSPETPPILRGGNS